MELLKLEVDPSYITCPITHLDFEHVPLHEKYDLSDVIGSDVTLKCRFHGPLENVTSQLSRKECKVNGSLPTWVPDDVIDWKKGLLRSSLARIGSTECTDISYPYRNYSSSYTFTVSREVCGVKCTVTSPTQVKEVTLEIKTKNATALPSNLEKEGVDSDDLTTVKIVIVACAIGLVTTTTVISGIFYYRRRQREKDKDNPYSEYMSVEKKDEDVENENDEDDESEFVSMSPTHTGYANSYVSRDTSRRASTRTSFVSGFGKS